ncbi:hypothetical protein MRX96_027973 [Rhipicephalus microplus]
MQIPNFGESARFCGFYDRFSSASVARQLSLTDPLGLATASAASDRTGGPAASEMTVPGPPIYGNLPTTGLSTDSRTEFGTNGHHRRRNFNRRDAGRHRRLDGDHPARQEDLGQRRNSASSFGANTRSAQKKRSNSRSESRGRARRHERSANRNRQRSLSRDRAWTDVVSGGAKSEKHAKTRQRSSTPARKPQNDPLTAKMLQLESTIKLMQESMRQQQETIRKQAEMITRLTSQQPRSGMQWNVSAPPTATLALSDATTMPPPPARDGQDPQTKESP